MQGKIDRLAELLDVIVNVHCRRSQRIHHRRKGGRDRGKKHIEHDQFKNFAAVLLWRLMTIVIDYATEHNHHCANVKAHVRR